MVFVPYQIDHQVNNAAKTLGFSKKRVTFKFGFANQQALDGGQAGAACRGSEHEVVFVWSLKSGKRQLTLDGKDVHYSTSGQNGWTSDRSWQHNFPLRDHSTGNEYRIHFITQPVRPEDPGVHPFDLRVNGVSYFKFNEIWKLGSSQMVVRGGSNDYGTSGGYHSRSHQDDGLTAEEQRQIAQAKLESLRDLEQKQKQQHHHEQSYLTTVPEQSQTADSLISFEPAPPSHVMVPTQSALAPQQQTAAAPAYGSGAMDPFASSYAAPPTAPSNTTAVASYTGAPAPYGGLPATAYPAQQPNPYAAPPAAVATTNPYGAPPPAYVPQTPTYGASAGASDNPFASPGGQTAYSYGSAPSFARPPAAQQQQQQQQPPQAGGYPAYPPPAGNTYYAGGGY